MLNENLDEAVIRGLLYQKTELDILQVQKLGLLGN